MLEQSIFTETLHEVAEIIRTSAGTLSKEEILDYFKDMNLNEQQKSMVLEFLLTPREEIEEEGNQDDSQEKEKQEQIEPLKNSKFEFYLEELKELPVYSEKKMQQMYEELLKGDESVIQKIADGWLNRVVETVKELAPAEEEFEDMVQEGNLALFLKLTELCGAGNGDVQAHLQQAVEFAVKTSIIAFEGEKEEEKTVVAKAALVREAKNYLSKEKGQNASLQELADYTRLEKEELSDILQLIETEMP